MMGHSDEDEDVSYHPQNKTKKPEKKSNPSKKAMYEKQVLVGDDSDASNLSNKSIRQTISKKD